MIKVSIIVPIFRNQEYLQRCINCLLMQTLDNIEIILATDGPEYCNIVCHEYKQKNPCITVIDHPGGYGKSLNRGIETAKGEYIGIVESDDTVSLKMFEKLYQTAKTYDADVVKGNFYHVKNRKIRAETLSKKIILSKTDINKNFWRFPVSIWSAIYKKNFLIKMALCLMN